MKPFRLLLLCAALTVATAVSADARALSLSDAVKLALANNPEVAAADLDTAVVRTKIRQIKANGRPQINLESSYMHLEEAPTLSVDLGEKLRPAFLGLANAIPNIYPVPAAQGGVNLPQVGTGGPYVIGAPNGGATNMLPVYANPYKAPLIASLSAADFSLSYPLSKQDMTRHTLTFQWPLFTFGRVGQGAKASKKATEAMEAKAQSKRIEVAFSVVKAYLSVQLANRSAQVNDTAYETIKQHVDQAEKLFKQGLIPQYELMRAQTELANQDRRRLDAHNQADLALAYLQDLLGIQEEKSVELTDKLSGQEKFDMTLDDATKAALESSFDMKALKAKDEVYIAAEKAARADLKPVVAAVGSKDLRTNDLPLTTPDAYIGIVVKMPIINNGSARAKAAEQARSLERNQSDIQRLQNGLRLMVRQSYLDITSARKALEAADKAVELATESRRLATRRFEVGEGTTMEVTDAILALSIAETNREQARFQYDIAYYSLMKAMSRILAEFNISGGSK